MNSLEITLIIIGIITIIISCLLVDKANKNKDSGIEGSTIDLIIGENKKLITDKIETVLSDISEEIIVRTDEALDRLSNEKIIAVNDFSEQILEKISKNHEEVVFLYSMLENKEKELKAAVKEIDLAKKKLQTIMELKAKNEMDQSLNANKRNASTSNQTDLQQEHTDVQKNRDNNQIDNKNSHESQAIANETNDMNDVSDMSSAAGDLKNNNQRILDLYSQGNSVLEISKQLRLGQGEVKLVIDLFQGKK